MTAGNQGAESDQTSTAADKHRSDRVRVQNGDLSRTTARPTSRWGITRGHFPNDAEALKCLYLVTRSLDPTARGRARWVARWAPALTAFASTFEGRIK